MSGYPEYYTVVYRNEQRVVILNENPAERVKPVKKKRVRNMAEEATVEPTFRWKFFLDLVKDANIIICYYYLFISTTLS